MKNDLSFMIVFSENRAAEMTFIFSTTEIQVLRKETQCKIGNMYFPKPNILL